MTCETVKNELVAYCDGELSEQDRKQVATHLSTCAACAREEAELARVALLFTSIERIAPSADFVANFWRRVEQEGLVAQENQIRQEGRFSRWWHEWHESLTGWQLAPVLAGAASLLIFLSSLLSAPSLTPLKQPTVPPAVPAQLTEELGLFVNYKIITDLDRLAHFEEIAAIQPAPEHETEVAAGEDLPPALLQNPGFFAHYQLFEKMDQMENLESVLSMPANGDAQHRG